jgi:hypothetical protein
MLVVDVATHVVLALGTRTTGSEQRVFGMPMTAAARVVDPMAHRATRGRSVCIRNPSKVITERVNYAGYTPYQQLGAV